MSRCCEALNPGSLTKSTFSKPCWSELAFSQPKIPFMFDATKEEDSERGFLSGGCKLSTSQSRWLIQGAALDISWMAPFGTTGWSHRKVAAGPRKMRAWCSCLSHERFETWRGLVDSDPGRHWRPLRSVRLPQAGLCSQSSLTLNISRWTYIRAAFPGWARGQPGEIWENKRPQSEESWTGSSLAQQRPAASRGEHYPHRHSAFYEVQRLCQHFHFKLLISYAYSSSHKNSLPAEAWPPVS